MVREDLRTSISRDGPQVKRQIIDDIGEAWPEFVRRYPVDGRVSAVELSARLEPPFMGGGGCGSFEPLFGVASALLFHRNPWKRGMLELFLESRPDSPVNRRVGFWRRHAWPGSPEVERWETSVVVDERVHYRAAAAVRSEDELHDRLTSPWPRGLARAFLVPTTDTVIENLLGGLDMTGIGSVEPAESVYPALVRECSRHACLVTRFWIDFDAYIDIIGPSGLVRELVPQRE